MSIGFVLDHSASDNAILVNDLRSHLMYHAMTDMLIIVDFPPHSFTFLIIFIRFCLIHLDFATNNLGSLILTAYPVGRQWLTRRYFIY